MANRPIEIPHSLGASSTGYLTAAHRLPSTSARTAAEGAIVCQNVDLSSDRLADMARPRIKAR